MADILTYCVLTILAWINYLSGRKTVAGVVRVAAERSILRVELLLAPGVVSV